jgi:hypothetical protein
MYVCDFITNFCVYLPSHHKHFSDKSILTHEPFPRGFSVVSSPTSVYTAFRDISYCRGLATFFAKSCVYTFSILTHKLLPRCLHFSLFTPLLCLYFAPFWHISFSPGVCLQSHHQPLCGRVWDRNRDQPWRGEDQIRIEPLETEEQKRGNHYGKEECAKRH